MQFALQILNVAHIKVPRSSTTATLIYYLQLLLM